MRERTAGDYTGEVAGNDKGANTRAVAHARVSPAEQRRHGYSSDGRERGLRIRVGLRGRELVEVVRDEGALGADPKLSWSSARRGARRRVDEVVMGPG